MLKPDGALSLGGLHLCSQVLKLQEKKTLCDEADVYLLCASIESVIIFKPFL